jgi:tRNA threonylcarbamoyladenosine biosynthesis protein TsaE
MDKVSAAGGQLSALEDLLPGETASPEETTALGRALAAAFGPGDVVALQGDLGTGKTHLVKGMAAAYGVPEEDVSSPTFTIVNEYNGRDFPIYHFDAYRVRDAAEWYEMGYEDYFTGAGLCLIEWPERMADLLPDGTVYLRLTHAGGDRRRIERGGKGEREKRE